MMNIDDEQLVKLSTSDTVEKHAAIIGMTGSGKTHFMKVLALELSPDIKLTIVDPEGDYSDLRFSRKTLVVGKGFPGQHVDIELTPETAAATADVLCHYDIPIVVLNLSGFEIDDQDEFVLNYVGQLWRNYRFEENLPPHRLIIDEVQLFAPQSEKTKSKYLLRDLARRGRKRQLTLAVATQEPQAVYKPLLNAAHYRVFLQVAKGTAMDAIKKLLPASVLNAPGKTDVQDMIASMNRGDALFMIDNNAKKIHIRASDATAVGSGNQLPLDDGNLDRLRQLIGANKMADDIKADVKREVEENSCIEELKAEIDRLTEENNLLRTQLNAALDTSVPTATVTAASTEVMFVPAPEVEARDIERIERARTLEEERQRRGYKNLLFTISKQSKRDRQVISYLADRDPAECDYRDIGIAVGLAVTTGFSLKPLVDAKLVTSRKVGRHYMYSTPLLKQVDERFPLIGRDQAREDIARLITR